MATNAGSSQISFTAVAAAIALALLGVAFVMHERGGGAEDRAAPAAWIETRVRTEPSGLPVTLDGKPVGEGRVRVRLGARPAEVAATWKCRRALHRIEASDAGTEVVLVMDPVDLELDAGPELAGAHVEWNGKDVGASPARIGLDLCTENRIEVRADGYRPARVSLPAGSTPLEARTAILGMRMERLVQGRIRVGPAPAPVRLLLDGRPIRPGRTGIETDEGRHELRAVNEEMGIDVRTEVDVPPAGEAVAELGFPALSSIDVQAFPSNCKIYVKKNGGAWRYVDDTPATLRLAAGLYRVRVRFAAGGEEQEREVRLSPGKNSPLRFALGRRR